MNDNPKPVTVIDSVTQNISGWTMTALAFLMPLFFLTSTANFYDPNKFLLVIIAASIIVTAWSVQAIVNKNARFTISQFTLPVLLIGLVYVASTVVAQPNKVESLMGRGLLIPLLTIIFLGATSLISSRSVVNKMLYALIGSATVLSFISIFQSLGGLVAKFINQLAGTTIPETLAFSPIGSPLALLTFVIPVFIASLLIAFTRNEGIEKIALFLLSAVMLGSIIINAIYVSPGQEGSPVILPVGTGYAIAVETLKQPVRTALLGYGPEGYLNAFTKIRPATFNLNEAWNIRFSAGSNELFTIVTSVGALGLFAWIFLIRQLLRSFSEVSSTTELKIIKLTTMVVFLIQLLLPTNIVVLTTGYLFLTMWALELKARSSRQVKDISLGLMEASALRPGEDQPLEGEKLNQSRIVATAIAVPLLAGVVALSYFTQRAYAGEVLLRKSLLAASQNDGTNTYEYQRQAIEKNPYVSGYHRTYAITNLQIASALAANPEASDQDRETIAQLIQQAIREGKSAVSLDTQKTANWETLAQVYRNLINVAEGADQWTVASYVQAVSTDPTNPRLRLELGGVFFRLGQYDQAIRLFQQAAELKPDWANAYYNLASAYREKGELQNAYVMLQTAVSLVDPASADAARAGEELAALRDELNLDEETPARPVQGELSQPAPLPTPLPEPIELPESAGPDNTQTNPAQPIQAPIE